MARGILKYARLSRRQLILFAFASAAVNGVVTATVGGYLAQTYSAYQSRHQAVESIAHHLYNRRTRAGMLASSIRRDADLDEVRHRKQAYDEAYVDWNKNVMLNLFVMREVAGNLKFSELEPIFEDQLVSAMADVDRCVTKAYDKKIKGEDAKAELAACGMGELHQFVLDCGATFINELSKMTKLSFFSLPGSATETKNLAKARIEKACHKPEIKKPDQGAASAPVNPPAASVPPSSAAAPAPNAIAPPH